MTEYRNDWGETANTEAEIITKNIQHMDVFDYARHLGYIMDVNRIIVWAINQPNFRNFFAEEIAKAEQDFADGVGWWWYEEGTWEE